MRCWCAGPTWSKPATTFTTPQQLPQLHPAPSTTSPPHPHPHCCPLPPGAAFSLFIPPPPGHSRLPAQMDPAKFLRTCMFREGVRSPTGYRLRWRWRVVVCLCRVVSHPEFPHLVCGCSPRLVFAPSAPYLQFTIYNLHVAGTSASPGGSKPAVDAADDASHYARFGEAAAAHRGVHAGTSLGKRRVQG